MRGDEFYSSHNLEKYPNNGKLDMCKKCLTMHVDNYNPDTFLWILQEVDVPYIPDEWNKIISSYVTSGRKMSGATILGRYLAKMKLKQWKDYRWEHTDFLQEQANRKIEETMKRSGYDAA
jgi:tRNA(Ile)-lysidine synthase TilS/MesJ